MWRLVAFRTFFVLVVNVSVCAFETNGERCQVELLQRKLSLAPRKPHVLLFVADDQGWAHLGAHRSAKNKAEMQGKAEAQTPNMDALISEGVLLERHYVASKSGPSRCSLISGRLPRQFPPLPEGLSTTHMFWNPADNVSGFYGIPRNMTGIGSKMKQAGYATHYLGKWDVGMATPEHTPPGRGFDSFLGHLQSFADYWSRDHAQEVLLKDVCMQSQTFHDFSLFNATYRGGVDRTIAAELGCHETVRQTAYTTIGCNMENHSDCLPDSCYEEAMLLKYAKELIRNHEPSTPLFLTFASQLVHGPLEVTRSSMVLEGMIQNVLKSFGVEREFEWTKRRLKQSAMNLYMDFVLGELVASLKERNMYDDTLIVYISDNGGASHVHAGASNHPLKGGKFSDWEGSLRTNAFISGGFIPAEHRGTSFEGVIHISDWYATLSNLAGVSHFDEAATRANEELRLKNLPLLAPVDGRPQMEHILSGSNGRPDALHLGKTALLKWPYKLITGQQEFSFWQGPIWPNCSTHGPIWGYVDVVGHKVRIEHNDSRFMVDAMVEDCGDGCLFNVASDPTEHVNLAHDPEYASILLNLQEELQSLNAQASTADQGEPRPDLACMQFALNGGFIGPFLYLGGFYSNSGSPSPHVDLPHYLEELRALRTNLSDPSFPLEVAREVLAEMPEPEVQCRA